MTDEKKYFLKHISEGTFYYELAILVCTIEKMKPIIEYTGYIWDLNYVSGPFDKNFNKIEVDSNETLYGILTLSGIKFPFMTMNIQEELANGNWFDICFHTSSIEEILELKNGYLNDKLYHPEILRTFFESILKELVKIHTFEIAMAGIEMGGMYDLEIFKNNEQFDPYGIFYIDSKNITDILEKNKRYLNIIN